MLVAAESGGYYGRVYEWDDDQRDARLWPDGEALLQVTQADGSVRQRRYTWPSQRPCGMCHSSSALGELGAGGEHAAAAPQPRG